MAGVRFAALWRKTNQQGEEYFEGPLGLDAVIRVYPNKYKKEDKQPDYVIYVNQAQENKQKGQYQKPQQQGQYQQQAPSTPRLPPHKRPDYVDHTQGGYSQPPSDDTPWPENEYADTTKPPF